MFSLKEKYGITDEEVTQNILKIHGLHNDNFDVIKNIETLITEKLNDKSIDDNSNKNEKTIEGIQQEAFAPFRKVTGYDFLYRKLKELYGREEAKRLCGEMFDFSLGLSDTTHILKPYCWAFNASNLVIEGRRFGQLHSKPCKRVESYISALCETIHQMSSHLAGAIAIGTFFLDISHILLFREKVELYRLKNDVSKRKKIENEFQQFVHSVNHLSRNGCESPFTNISVFDKIKLKTLISDMEFYFPIDELPIVYSQPIENEEKKKEFAMNYLIEYITELQDIYVEFFNKGDPERNGLPYRFPVTTLNLSKTEKQETYEISLDNSNFVKFKKGKVIDVKKENTIDEKLDIDTLFQVKDQRAYYYKDGDSFVRIKNITKKQGAELMDLEALKKACKFDIYRFNIFVSSGNKVASCCFSGGEMIKVKNVETGEIFLISMSNFIKKLEIVGEKKVSGWKIMSLNPETMKEEEVDVTGALNIENKHECLIHIETPNGSSIDVTPDHILLVKEENTDLVREITAEEYAKNFEKYLLPVE